MLSVSGRSNGSWERRHDFKVARIIWNFTSLPNKWKKIKALVEQDKNFGLIDCSWLSYSRVMHAHGASLDSTRKLAWVDLNKILNNRSTLMFHNKLNHNLYRDDFISWRVDMALFTWRRIGKAPSSTATQRLGRKSDELME